MVVDRQEQGYLSPVGGLTRCRDLPRPSKATFDSKLFSARAPSKKVKADKNGDEDD